MDIIKNIKSIIDDYNRYKNPRNTKALVNKGVADRRNVFKYIKLKNFSKKYSDELYKHFGIMNDLHSYEFLVNMFGEKKIKEALGNPEFTASQIADVLLTPENLEAFYNSEKEYYFVKTMSEHIAFNRATGLEWSSLKDGGINPNTFTRKCYGSHNDKQFSTNTILDIWKENNVSKEVLKEIYDIYGDEIVEQYNSDMNLRNRTVLMTDEKYSKSLAVGGLQDHVTYYSEDNFKEIFDKYFKGEELKENEKYILMGLLTKTTDLIALYSINYLKEKPDFIKSEIKLGIFQDIVVGNKKYTNDERKKLVSLEKLWNSDDLARYNNLLLLKERLAHLYKGQELSEKIAYIEDIISKPLEEVIEQAEDIAEYMHSIFMKYEIDNRENIIESVYNPDEQETIVIDDLEKMGSAAMLHFFEPTRTISNFNAYIKDLEEKRSKQFGKKYVFSDEEKKAMELQYTAKENHFITDYSLDFEGIGQVGSFDTRYVTNTSNQLCALIAKPKAILEGNGLRGNIALRIF